MNSFLKQLQLSLRSLRKRPAYSLVAVLMLAVGIGAATSVFTVANSVLLKRPAFRDPDRIEVVVSLAKDAKGVIDEYGSSIYDYLDWRDRNTVFSDLSVLDQASVSLTGSGEPQQVEAARISANLFNMLGVQPALGRWFHQDEQTETSHVVILSYSLWRNNYGADPNLPGHSVYLDGVAYTVVGVAPDQFYFAVPSALWIPIDLQVDRNARSSNRAMSVAGRLKDGITEATASAQMSAIAKQLEREFPASNKDWGVRMTSLPASLTKDIKPALWILMAAVGFLLLITCANVANLTLARTLERESDIAVRVALGAGRGDIFRELLAEGLLISIAGGLLGLLLTALFLGPIVALSPLTNVGSTTVPALRNLRIDYNVLIFTCAVSILTAILAGILPAFRSGKRDLAIVMKENSRSASGGTVARRVQKILVVTELALSFVLLAGALILLNGFVSLLRVDPGFRTENTLSLRMSLPAARYESHPKRAAFIQTLQENLASIPGVESAAVSTRLPLNEFGMVTVFEVEGHPAAPGEGEVSNFRRISPDFFRTMGIRLLEGRDLNKDDVTGAQPVAVVSRELAQRYWPGQSAIGRSIRRLSPADNVWRKIVGVVDSVRDDSLSEPVGATLYIPYAQGSIANVYVVVHSTLAPGALAKDLQKTIWRIDPELAVYDILPLDEVFRMSLSRPRFYMMLISLFAGLGLLVGAIGVYGVTSYTVVQRTGEIAVRLALGAQRRSVLRMILKETSVLAISGASIGLLVSLSLVKVLASIIPVLPAGKTTILIVVLAALFLISLIAAWIPAQRASRLDPLLALHYE